MAFFFHKSRGDGSISDPSSAVGDGVLDRRDFSFMEERSCRRRGGDSGPGSARTRVDWIETPESHVYKADMPGLKKEDIKVEVVDDRMLTISGERNAAEIRKETDSYRCVERSYGKFRRQFGLPENSRAESVSARVEDGVLTVTVPKSKKDVPEVRAIEVA